MKVSIPYLKYDPLRVFFDSNTPSGLYARQRWLYLEKTNEWKKAYRDTIDALLSGQRKDGSWGGSILITVHRLFELHLTLRNTQKQISKALDYLLLRKYFLENGKTLHKESHKVTAQDLEYLPFSPGCYEHFVKGAILFLATIFGKEKDERVTRVYEMLHTIGVQKMGKWCGWSCSNNILRAFVAHPVYAKSKVIRLYLGQLAEIQQLDGGWRKPIPFYQTVNALGHLHFKQAENLLRKAFWKLEKTQNKDGTWGKSQKEWNTFLVTHAMQRKRHLLSMKKIKGAP